MLDINKNHPQKRPYQKDAIKTLIGHLKDLLNGILEGNGGKYETASLIEMATGSGKTFTIGKYLDLIIYLRNRYHKEYFSGLNILVLSNRIDGVEQFRDDLVHGKLGEDFKNPILSKTTLKNLRVSTFHSKADNLDDLDGAYFTNDEQDETEIFSLQNGKIKDNILFSTYQTANLKCLDEKVPYFDIIIIDEAHNVKAENDFELLIDKLAVKGRNGKSPHIIPLTATPTNLTLDLFGEAIYSYPLAEYLASEYSPGIEYKLITQSNASKEDIEFLSRIVEDAKNIKDPSDKKELIKEIEKKFEEMMTSYPDLSKLVDDLLTRILVDNGDINETIIFANSIDEADMIANQINKQLGKEVALAYHSKNDTKALFRLNNKNDTVKIVVAVNKLNESIDLPVVSNIVFWRNTDIAKIFLQQFGRGLRGDGIVKYYDYVGGLKNFSWIGAIYEKYKQIVDDDENNKGGERWNKFKLLGGNLSSSEHSIDLTMIGFDIAKLKNSLTKLTAEEIIEYFKKNGTIEYWKNLLQKERVKVKINGVGIVGLSRIMKVDGNPYGYTKVWYELLSKIFNEKVEYKELTKEEVIKYFKENGTLEYWKLQTQLQRKNIYIRGYGMVAIGTVLGVGNPMKNRKSWYEFLGKIFGEEIESKELTSEKIIEYFKKNGTFEYWKSLIKDRRTILKIERRGLNKISKIMGVEGNPISNTKVWYELVGKIFKEKIDELNSEKIIEYFNKNGTLDYWKEITQKEKQKIKIDGIGLIALSTIMGVKGDPIIQTKIWYEFLSKIFDEKIEEKKLTKEEIIKYFQENGTLEYWKSLKAEDRFKVKIGEFKLYTVTTIMGIKGEPSSYKVWYELLGKIFDAKIEILTKEKVIKYFKENGRQEYWLNLKLNERRTVKINGFGLGKLSTLIGVKGNPVNSKDVWYEFLSKIFDEKNE